MRMPGIGVGADGGQEAQVELSMVDRAMARLPADQREAVLLVMVEGYSYKEAAAIVDCPVGTLNSRLVRGRDALMAMLEDRNEHLDDNLIAAYADGELDWAEAARSKQQLQPIRAGCKRSRRTGHAKRAGRALCALAEAGGAVLI